LSPPSDNTLAQASRRYFYRYVVSSAKQHGLIPFVWDIPMGMYNRGFATVLDQGIIDAMNQGTGNAYVTLTNDASGQLVDGMSRTTNGSAAGQWSNSGSDAQKWQLVPAGRYVNLVNKATGLYLDGLYSSTNGSAAGQWNYSGSDAQFWLIQPLGNYFTLSNKATGMYLDGNYNWTNGANAVQWTQSGSTAQQWTIGTVGNVQTSGVAPATTTGQAATWLVNPTPGGVQAYPNPFSSAFHLAVPDPASVDHIAIFDVSGRQVELIGHSAVSASMLLGGSLGTGEYVVKIFGKSGSQTFKLIKISK